MYQVEGRTNVAYTKNQLQVVSSKEKQPPKTVLRTHIIQKILEKVKHKGLIHYKVEWNDGDTTLEPRKKLIEEVPAEVERFEKSLKQVVPIEILEREKVKNVIQFLVKLSNDKTEIMSRKELNELDPDLVEHYERRNKK
jgi:hypothetical protein